MKVADFQFTSFAVSYPNGDSTQRIGVGPQKPGDVLVQITQDAIRHDRDDILEAALRAAGCPLNTEEIHQIMNDELIYPKPATSTFSIQVVNNTNTIVKVYSLTGQLMLQTKQTENINVASLPSGTYIIQVLTNGKTSTQKLIKQ